ncbi:hypothetical protein [Alcaligenes sp. SDU_A2]|uniref:hypothetical protein n=1 Tax=Alcaligenes sp. SDU_A2 TaxID=3136634 RepID=UPI002B62A4F7|nr:hypothetical protein [Alcaligenes sp.]HRL26882.1 hypothetical protein [Alcaligenes sp.]
MFSDFVHYALPLAATLMLACALTALASGAYLLLFNLRSTHQALRHPYLDQHPWSRLPITLKAGILLDYFLRLNFPSRHSGVFGNANRLLAHVQRDQVPMGIKWPLMGLWGGCFIGLVCMLALWVLIALQPAAT